MLLHKLYINVVIANIFLRTCFLETSETKIQAIREKKTWKKQWYFSQNQKEFDCIGAAVLLILSPKELIWQKNAAVNFGYHCHDLAQNYDGWEIVET